MSEVETKKQPKVKHIESVGTTVGFTKNNIRTKENKRHFKSEFKEYIVGLLENNGNVRELAHKWNIPYPTLYAWARKVKNNKDKVINSQTEQPEGTRKKSKSKMSANLSSIDVKFCPCCGTDIRAVAIALETTSRM